jgi:hypothetical protein
MIDSSAEASDWHQQHDVLANGQCLRFPTRDEFSRLESELQVCQGFLEPVLSPLLLTYRDTQHDQHHPGPVVVCVSGESSNVKQTVFNILHTCHGHNSKGMRNRLSAPPKSDRVLVILG